MPKATTKPARKREQSRRCALAIEGLGAPVEIRRHPSARRMTLRVSQVRRAVIVTMPLRCRIDEADSFLHRNLAWVQERLGSMPPPVPFADGASVPFRGVRHSVVYAAPVRGAGVVTVDATGTVPRLIVRGQPEHCPRRLRDWMMSEARVDIAQRVAVHAKALSLRPGKIVLRDQASRWGSCTSAGVLSFSWRLIMAPPYVLDYVAAHEVAHLAEMNHGPRFWSLVRQTFPDMDAAKRWLRLHGTELHRYAINAGPSSAANDG